MGVDDVPDPERKGEQEQEPPSQQHDAAAGAIAPSDQQEDSRDTAVDLMDIFGDVIPRLEAIPTMSRYYIEAPACPSLLFSESPP